MKEPSIVREYGVPIDPKIMIEPERHRTHACSIYLNAKDALGISTTAIPQLGLLSGQLERATQVHLGERLVLDRSVGLEFV